MRVGKGISVIGEKIRYEENNGIFCSILLWRDIRIDNRVGRNRLIKDKKRRGFLKCNQEMYDQIKNHPEMKDYSFVEKGNR